MAKVNPYLIATVTAIGSAVAFSAVKYYQQQKVDLVDVAIFAIIFWICFFLAQKYFKKKQK